MTLLAFLAFIFIFFSLRSLHKKVADLENEVYLQKRKSVNLANLPSRDDIVSFEPKPMDIPPAFSEYQTNFSSEGESFVPQNFSVPEPMFREEHVAKPTREFFLVTWFREQTLIKVGSIIFFFGAVWFVSYAIEQNWVSPLSRIALGLLLACAVYAIGLFRFRQADETQFQVLTVLGTGVFLGTVVASQFAFTSPIVPAGLAFLLMAVSVGYTVAAAYFTKTEWLAITAGVAGLFVPLMVNFSAPQPVLELAYLGVLSLALLEVVFITKWRKVSLVLLIGVFLHLLSIYSAVTMTNVALWWFVLFFSVLFFAATSISVLRTNEPDFYDVASLTLLLLQFVGYSVALTAHPEVVLFVGAAVSAGVGYVLRTRAANADAVSLYAVISLVSSLVATAQLFDGFVLTIAYALEILGIYVLALRLATVKRSIYVAAMLFALPVISGFQNLTSPAWETGIFQRDALGVLSVFLVLIGAVVWTLRTEAMRAVVWLRATAAALTVVWYMFSVSAIAVVSGALPAGFHLGAWATILSVLISALVIVYVLRFIEQDHWRLGALFTLAIPVISAMKLLTDPLWIQGVVHQPGLAAFLLWLWLGVVSGMYFARARRKADESAALYAYGIAWGVLGYGLLFISVAWNSLLVGDVARVVIAVSYFVLVYVALCVFMLLRLHIVKITTPLLLLIIPGGMLAESLRFTGWHDGVLGINAVGLYVAVVVLCLLATSLLQHKAFLSESEKGIAQETGVVLYSLAGLLGFLLVWIESHTVITSPAMAVTVSLLVYTIVGLAAYSYGKIKTDQKWLRVGILLLSAVILRLGLIDVWNMEMVWRIVTFLVVGGLFIGTALMERSRVRKHS